jgi:ADP-ribosylglycohydrolase
MERYVRWWKEGYLSSTGTCFDIGSTTRTALSTFIKTGNPLSGPTDSFSAGNGSLMRLAAVPLFYAGNPREAIEKSGESSKTTHGAPAAIDACRYFGALIVGVLNGEDKETILSDHYCPAPGYWKEKPLIPEIAEIATGSFKYKNPPQIRGSGYVAQSLESALWAFYHSDSFAEGCLLAVNLGDDADTTGAIYGQIAGAYYGKDGIPDQWCAKISKLSLIAEIANKLYYLPN